MRRVRREHSTEPPAEPATLDLYAPLLPIGPDTVVELTHRVDAGHVQPEPAVATAEPGGPGQAPTYPLFPVAAGGAGRQTTAVPLTGLSGTLRRPAVRLTGGGQVRRRLGGLAVRETPTSPAAPVALRITDADGGSPRFARQPAPGTAHGQPPPPRATAKHSVLPDGTRRFPGGTCRRAYCAGELAPEQDESVARFELRTVGELYNVSMPATTTPRW
ncbi:hypothetical protein [Streptomyces glomeratus]|uniref:hypothetical protein n=2 Tax=Streptomyces glomeratus TaxID=284452 RepID=UPI001F485B3F|nr:hypothetical protein [Streptomyces glomeratus]MCF1509643.1 hypothetical protein [Streptomyces glomeratus]